MELLPYLGALTCAKGDTVLSRDRGFQTVPMPEVG